MKNNNISDSVMKKKIAILMTCFNRKEVTLKCLKNLFENKLNNGVYMNVYLVDDGSSDGTSDNIRYYYPNVKILEGTGSLFWCGGMRVAFNEAIKGDYDYYLWLNDDTLLEKDAITKLLNTYEYVLKEGYKNSIVVGSTKDPNTGELNYGGRVRSNLWHPLKFYKLVEPDEYPKQCETFNGNCVLIPRAVIKLVGNLDSSFTHDMGDFDYGLRARKKECFLWVASGFIGECSSNKDKNKNLLDKNKSLKENIAFFNSPKIMPFNERKIYAKRHGGKFWFIFFYGVYTKYHIRLFIMKFFSFLNTVRHVFLLKGR